MAAAICVGLLPVLRPRATGKVLQDWTGARAASEALKTEIYLYLARARRLHRTRPGLSFARTAEKIEDVASGLLPYLIGIEPKKRDLPRVTDPKSYFAVRVAEQVDVYFKAQTKRLTQTLRRFKVVEVTLTIGAVVLGALAATVTQADLAPWIAVLTTIPPRSRPAPRPAATTTSWSNTYGPRPSCSASAAPPSAPPTRTS